ncbi:MAG: GNAT family N-acetyltransferase [Verrucomicrobiota bacterium]
MAFILTYAGFPAPDGPFKIAPIPWDSALLDFPVFEINCAQTPLDALARHLPAWLAGLPRDRAVLVVAKIAPDAVAVAAALAQHGFYPVETMLEFELLLARLTPVIKRTSAHMQLRMATPDDLAPVRSIAQSAFTADRFHLDPNVPRNKADWRYAHWIENSFRAGDPVFVLEDTAQSEVIGFVQARATAPQTMDITLGAVRKHLQNSGAGVLMYQELFLALRARDFKRAVTRVSINNLRGIKLTLRLGFIVRAAVVALHWFRRGTKPD